MPEARVGSQGPGEAEQQVVEVVPAAEELVERGPGRCIFFFLFGGRVGEGKKEGA